MTTEIPLEVTSYDDSWFTNSHDLVRPLPVHDGRGTFTHLGVRMEGLESGRHVNFQSEPTNESGFQFYRNHAVVNEIWLRVQGAVVGYAQKLVLNTQFYTRNQTKFVYEVALVHGDTRAERVVVQNLGLQGDAVKEVELTGEAAQFGFTAIRLRVSEGGLARFHAFGRLEHGRSCQWENLVVGARVFGASDASYGDPSLVLREQRQGVVMAGWECCRHSSRHRLGLALAKPAPQLDRLEIDTYLHCLNPFRFFCVLACSQSALSDEQLLKALPQWRVVKGGAPQTVDDDQLNAVVEQLDNLEPPPVRYELVPPSASDVWKVLLPMTALKRDTLHSLDSNNSKMIPWNDAEHPITHLVLLGVPDGGIHRFGAYKKVSD